MATPTSLNRTNIRLPATAYRGRRLYFLTLCFHHRRRFGANPPLARWLIQKLRKHAAVCEFFVHAYCVMPDHVHVLAAAATDTSNLMKFVESFKQDTAAAFSRRTHRQLWQFKYYDRILRGKDSADRVDLLHLAKPRAQRALPRTNGLSVPWIVHGRRFGDVEELHRVRMDPSVEDCRAEAEDRGAALKSLADLTEACLRRAPRHGRSGRLTRNLPR